jgi:hypothetical protein
MRSAGRQHELQNSLLIADLLLKLPRSMIHSWNEMVVRSQVEQTLPDSREFLMSEERIWKLTLQVARWQQIRTARVIASQSMKRRESWRGIPAGILCKLCLRSKHLLHHPQPVVNFEWTFMHKDHFYHLNIVQQSNSVFFFAHQTWLYCYCKKEYFSGKIILQIRSMFDYLLGCNFFHFAFYH